MAVRAVRGAPEVVEPDPEDPGGVFGYDDGIYEAKGITVFGAPDSMGPVNTYVWLYSDRYLYLIDDWNRPW